MKLRHLITLNTPRGWNDINSVKINLKSQTYTHIKIAWEWLLYLTLLLPAWNICWKQTRTESTARKWRRAEPESCTSTIPLPPTGADEAASNSALRAAGTKSLPTKPTLSGHFLIWKCQFRITCEKKCFKSRFWLKILLKNFPKKKIKTIHGPGIVSARPGNSSDVSLTVESIWLYLAISLCSVRSIIIATIPDKKRTMTREFMMLQK